MAVHCEGDCWIMEQLGERQDFESELSRLGFRHEEFSLCVRRAATSGPKAMWNSNYAVQVTNLASGKRNIYWGGPREQWVTQFALDLATGMYGRPALVQPATRSVRSAA